MDQIGPNFVVYIILIVLLLRFMLSGSRSKLLEHLRNLLIWGCFFFIALVSYSYKDPILNLLAPALAELSPGRPIIEGKTLTYKKSLDGHFHVYAKINDIPIEFLVDTGATDVTLSLKDALQVGIDTSNLVFDKQYNTANGLIKGASIRVDISIEQAIFPEFLVSVNSGSMDKSLMGMSLLSRFDEITIDGNELKLSY